MCSSDLKQAFARSPRDPFRGAWHMELGLAESCLGRLDVGIAELKRAIDAGYRTFIVYAFLAGAEAANGNDAEAKIALAEARRINPQLTIKWSEGHLPVVPERMVEGWRRAGLPEE